MRLAQWCCSGTSRGGDNHPSAPNAQTARAAGLLGRADAEPIVWIAEVLGIVSARSSHFVDASHWRTLTRPREQFLHTLASAGNDRLDASIAAVTNPTVHAQLMSATLHRLAKPNVLDASRNEEMLNVASRCIARSCEPTRLTACDRSEERRVGKECIPPCRSRWWPYH